MRYPKEHYRECGYEDVGYRSPDLTSDSVYPDYLKEEAKRVTDKVNKEKGEHSLVFGYMTDIHLATNNNHITRFTRTMNAYNDIAKGVGCDTLILGGDYVNEGCKEYKRGCYDKLRELLGGKGYFPANGNHDDGTIWDKYYIENEGLWVNHFSHKDLFDVFYSHIKDEGAVMPKNSKGDVLYYYKNFEKQKVRVVFLDMEDIPYIYEKDGKLRYEGQHDYSVSDAQYNWLAKEALHFEEKGWTVLFVMHIMARQYGKDCTQKRLFAVHDVIKAFKNREKFVYKYDEPDFEVNLKCDFTKETGATVAGVFVGHYHYDDVVTEDGISYIPRAHCVLYQTKINSDGMMKEDGNKNELCFDIVNLDTMKKTITVTRVGAGHDTVVHYD